MCDGYLNLDTIHRIKILEMKTSYVDKNSSNNRTLTKVVVDAYVYVCGRGGVLRFYA